MITQERLKEVLRYEPETGFFFWRVRKANCISIGDRAGSLSSDGYWHLRIDGKQYKAHRAAWLYVHGAFPKGHLDHKNQIKTDCRIENLREATREQNLANQGSRKSYSNLRGVYWRKAMGKWGAQISRNRKHIHLGFFSTAEEAHAAWCVVAKQLDGEFFYSGTERSPL